MKRLLFVPFLFICLASFATNYYIKNAGSDSSNGLSDSSAWATIEKVNASMSIFNPGDSVLFKRGDSWINSTIVIGTAGTPEKNIIIGSYGSGEKPVIEGPENHAAIIVTTADRGFWTIDNLDLRATGKTEGVYNTVAIYHGYWLKDLGAIPGWVIQNCKFNSCVLLSGPNTIVRNNIFNGAGNIYNRGGAICFRGPECKSCIAEFNTISNYYDRGIWIYNGGSSPVFRNNNISHIPKGTDHGGSGINVDGHGSQVFAGEIYNNFISNVDMYAITFENGLNASVYNNRTENSGGVMIWQYPAYVGTGDIDIHHNVFHNGNVGIVIFNGKGIKMAHNTFIKNDELGDEKIALYFNTSSNYVSEISFVNNIVAGNWVHLIKIPDIKDIWSAFDYNIMFPLHPWIMNRAGKNLALSEVRSLGYMLHGGSFNPLFIDPLSDWNLQPQSPAINTGIKLNYLTDIVGNPIDTFPDIGAFEYYGKPVIPILLNCSVEDVAPNVLVLNFNVALDNSLPPLTAFEVNVNSTEIMIESLMITGSKLSVFLSESIKSGDSVTITYTKPQSAHIQSLDGGDVRDIELRPVTNNVLTKQNLAATYVGSTINDDLPDLIEISYDLPLADIIPDLNVFTVTLNSRKIAINSASVFSGNLLLTLSLRVTKDDIVTFAYTRPTTKPLQTREGGLIETFGPVAVTNNVITANSEFKIFPNPSRDFITISGIENSFDELIVKITDLSSKPLLETTLKMPFSSEIIPIPLKAGLYIIYIISGTTILHSGKLIVR